jgi:hypothetical protein
MLQRTTLSRNRIPASIRVHDRSAPFALRTTPGEDEELRQRNTRLLLELGEAPAFVERLRERRRAARQEAPTRTPAEGVVLKRRRNAPERSKPRSL